MENSKFKLQIQQFCCLLLKEETYDSAFQLLQELNRCKLPKILKKHVYRVVWKHSLTLYHRRSFQECLRWSNDAFNMSVCLQESNDQLSIASVIADIYLQTKEWSQLENHFYLFRELNHPFKECMFKLELALCKAEGIEMNLAQCLRHANSLHKLKKVTTVILKHGDTKVMSEFSLKLLDIAGCTDFTKSEVATIFSIVLILAGDGDFLDVLMAVLGRFMEWNQKLERDEKLKLEMEIRTIMDHCENWIDSKLKESACHVAKETLDVGTQMCAVLLMLYDPKEDMPHICRTLSHQAQLLCKLKGLNEAKNHLLKTVSRLQSKFPDQFLRQILLDVQLENLRFDPILRLKYFQSDKLPENATSLLMELNNLPKTSSDDKNDMLGNEIMLRLVVANLLELENDKDKKDLKGLIEQVAKQLFDHIDPTSSSWLSSFFYEIGLISGSSALYGYAAKLQCDFSTRIRMRTFQLNAIYRNENLDRDEITEAVKEIVTDDLSLKDYESMKLQLVLKFKGYLILEDNDNEIKDLVSLVIRHKDWTTLEVFASLLATMGSDRKLYLKCLRYSNTLALHDRHITVFMRTGLLLIRQFVDKLDFDSINNLVTQIITLANPEREQEDLAADEVQVLILLILESLVNLHQRQILVSSTTSKKQLELQTELKSIISSLTGLVNEEYNEKYINQLKFEKGGQ